jgi:hypothetical protein
MYSSEEVEFVLVLENKDTLREKPIENNQQSKVS